jgi:Zn-dependent peptidase ImmA (M78 family)
MIIRRNLVRKAASDLLARCSITAPPVDVEVIADHLQVKLLHELGPSDVSGFLTVKGGRAAIGVNSEHSETRQRFTIAHELGHLVLHREAFEKPHVDKFETIFRDSQSSSGEDRLEVEANLFAAELLMPETLLSESVRRQSRPFDIVEDADLKTLAAEYGVSPQALLIRLGSLKLIGS